MLSWRATTIAIVVLMAAGGGLYGQNDSLPTRTATMMEKSAALSVDFTLAEKAVPLGQSVWTFATINNLSKTTMSFPSEVRVHVEGEKGEPSTTLYQRQITHRLLQGETAIRGGGYEPTIERGTSFTRKYDLAKYYDLSRPGQYSVYIEMLDESASEHNAGTWVRSKTIQFEVR